MADIINQTMHPAPATVQPSGSTPLASAISGTRGTRSARPVTGSSAKASPSAVTGSRKSS